MSIIKSMIIAISMYSQIPMPQFVWKKEDMRYVMAFFPLVGLVVGGLEILWKWLADLLHLPIVAVSLIALLLPILLTGGIHLDGFMDTSDALHSYGEPEKKREILKDPHSGAFAVISLITLLGITLAAWICLYNEPGNPQAELLLVKGWTMVSKEPQVMTVGGMLMLFFLPRVLSGISVLTFPKMQSKGTVQGFADASEKRCLVALILEMLAGLVWLMTAEGWIGLAGAVGLFLVFGTYHHIAVRQFGGINGDLAGWFVCIAECVMLTVMAFILWLVRM